MAKKKEPTEIARLEEPVGPAKKKKSVRSKLILALDIVVGIIVLISSVPIGICIYRNINYQEVFFVNGASMFPTLNGYAYRSSTGKLCNWMTSTNVVGDCVDYGWGKSASADPAFYDKLKRYDVVITHYASDYTDSTYTTLKNEDMKVKRLIGFPGETVTITFDKESEDYNTVFGYSVWGKTTITKPDGESFVLPNLYSTDDFEPIEYSGGTLHYENSGNYITRRDNVITASWTLADDEYFVMGDNRRHSSDSRAQGPVKRFMIQAKACMVVSRREIVSTKNGLDCKFRLDMLRMPWNFQNLEDHS